MELTQPNTALHVAVSANIKATTMKDEFTGTKRTRLTHQRARI